MEDPARPFRTKSRLIARAESICQLVALVPSVTTMSAVIRVSLRTVATHGRASGDQRRRRRELVGRGRAAHVTAALGTLVAIVHDRNLLALTMVPNKKVERRTAPDR